MSLNFNLNQELTQKITTELIQNLKVLQLSNSELNDYIYEKSNENPLIDINDTELSRLNNLVELSGINTYPTFNQRANESYNPIESLQCNGQSFENFLIEQIPLNIGLTSLDIAVLKYLILNLEENYFLDIDENHVMSIFTIENERFNFLLNILQSFEPIGVGARDFQEYLLLKVQNDQAAPPVAQALIENHYKLMTEFSIKKIQKIYKLTLDEVKEVFDYLKSIGQKSSGEGHNSVEYIIPDIEVKKINNELIIEILKPYRSKIEINKDYAELLQQNSEYSDVYKNYLNDALLLIRGIEHRDKTLYKIMRILIEQQKDFFETNPNHIQPLKLKDIAAFLNVHESTISRAIRNKYVKTPLGTFSIKVLFSKALINDSGKSSSVNTIKTTILSLINNENREEPLTDQKITDILNQKDIKISRRTVMKYREELNILSSAKRMYI